MHIYIVVAGVISLLLPTWALAMSLCGLLDAKRDKIVCETLDMVDKCGIPFARLPKNLVKKVV